MPRGVNPVDTAVHADSLGKVTCTALFRQAKTMQNLPDHCSLNNVTDVQRLTTVSGSVQGVTVNKQCICLHYAVNYANAEFA